MTKLEKILKEMEKEHEAMWAIARADKAQMAKYKKQQEPMVIYRGRGRFSY